MGDWKNELARIKTSLIINKMMKKVTSAQQKKGQHVSASSLSPVIGKQGRIPAFGTMFTPPVSPAGSLKKKIVLSEDFSFSGILTKIEEFKPPDIWVLRGEELDYSGNKNGRILTVRLGIDFGTAYTKVAYNIADKVYFVKWHGVRNTTEAASFFLPCEMSATEDKTFVLGRHSEQSEVLNNLKRPFLRDKPGEADSFAPIIIFVAWVFRYVRAWIYKEHENIISGRKIVYQVNFGKPSSGFSWQNDDKYKKIVKSAWRLSQLKYKDFTMQTAGNLLGQNIDENIGLDQLSLIPEFAAQVAGYAQSNQREDGLHMAFDIGAGTIDVSLFNLYGHPEEGEKIPIFSSEVQPLGTHFLMERRICSSGMQIKWNNQHTSMSTDTFADCFNCDFNKIRACDDKFTEDVKLVLKSNLHFTRWRRYPLSPAWNNGLRTFIFGGGVHCKLYTNAIQDAFNEMHIKLLNMKHTYFDQNDKEMLKNSNRLSVAYGLTFDRDVIGKIEEQDKNPDIVPEPERLPPSWEDIYSK